MKDDDMRRRNACVRKDDEERKDDDMREGRGMRMKDDEERKDDLICVKRSRLKEEIEIEEESTAT